jgi:hypothetical protein
MIWQGGSIYQWPSGIIDWFILFGGSAQVLLEYIFSLFPQDQNE